MKAVLDEAAALTAGRRKLVARFVFGLMVLLSALIGAMSGLLLIYSTDLPQVEGLQNYRPISTTQLYDIQGRTIGTCALQPPLVASHDDFPQVLRHAPISPQDKA